jgi:hypothetical protein
MNQRAMPVFVRAACQSQEQKTPHEGGVLSLHVDSGKSERQPDYQM